MLGVIISRLVSYFNYFYLSFLRGFLKWWVHLATGKCELLRIALAENQHAKRTRRIEYSMALSRYDKLRHALAVRQLNADELTAEVIRVKSIDLNVYPEFEGRFRASLLSLVGYNQLIAGVEARRQIGYSTENQQHEQLLLKLWSLLCPDTPLEARVTRQWGDIGFQGDDPATDFRGMGLLGLENLVYMAERRPDVASHLLGRSKHPQFGYSFAIVGINITSLAYRLLHSGTLKMQFYETMKNAAPGLDDFHRVYVCLFSEFDKFWFNAQPDSIMRFNEVLNDFQTDLARRLDVGPLSV